MVIGKRVIELSRLCVVLLGLFLLAASPATYAASHTASYTAAAKSVRIYLVNVNGKGIGCGGGLVPVVKAVKPTTAPLKPALKLLLADRHVCPHYLCSALARSNLAVKQVSIVKGKASVYLTGKLSLGGVCDTPRVRGQLRATALQFSTVRQVSFFVNNKPLTSALSQK